MADRGAGRVVGGRVGRTLAVAFALVATLFVGSVGAPGSVSAETDTNPEFVLIPADLEFMLKQIQIAEAHAAGGDLLCALPTDLEAQLREVLTTGNTKTLIAHDKSGHRCRLRLSPYVTERNIEGVTIVADAGQQEQLTG